MSAASSPILVLPPRSDLAIQLGLPAAGDNLFNRLIRNPRPDSPNPKERECTEMLCSVLRNTEVLQRRIVEWLAGLLGQDEEPIQGLQFDFDTEQPIGSKRDDLRIRGWRIEGEERELAVLWTVEVKVGAGFHYGSSIVDDAIDGTDEGDLVNQLVNYDHWLSKQMVERKAGIVLARSDCTDLLPPTLKTRWACVSWTRLGEYLELLLRRAFLPELDEFLAKQLLGFIREHLWSASEMTQTELEFDDIALIRAFAQLGRNCEAKIDQLVAPLSELVKAKGIGVGNVTHQAVLFKGYQRSVVWRNIYDPAEYPTMMAGVEREHIALWLETPAGSRHKSAVTSAVTEVLPMLQQRDERWHLPEESHRDLAIWVPLTTLLGTSNQEERFQSFFAKALDDIAAVELPQLIERKVKGQ